MRMRTRWLLIIALTLTQSWAAALAQRDTSLEWVAFVFERSWSGPSGQDYRVELYGDGRVRYEGKYRVKTTGVEQFTIQKKDVVRFVDGLGRIGFFEFQPKLGVSKSTSRLTTTVGFYRDGKTYAVVYDDEANEAFDLRLYELMEQFVPTRSLRCPYVMPPARFSRELRFAESWRNGYNG